METILTFLLALYLGGFVVLLILIPSLESVNYEALKEKSDRRGDEIQYNRLIYAVCVFFTALAWPVLLIKIRRKLNGGDD